MGASGWEYVVPYQQDLGAALDALRQKVFASGDYIKPSFYGDIFDLPDPASLEDLLGQERYWEFMGTSGTHSVIDVQAVVAAAAGDELGAIRPLSDEECAELFGTEQPGRADFDALSNSEGLYDYVTGGRWTGRAAVLWADAPRPRLRSGVYRGTNRPAHISDVPLPSLGSWLSTRRTTAVSLNSRRTAVVPWLMCQVR